jgi:cyclin-dependent kinase 10
VVYRARDKRSSKIVALKQVRIFPAERQNGIPITAIREISILRSVKHQNVVNVLDVAVGDGEDEADATREGEGRLDEVYMVMEYAEQVCPPFPGEG